MHDDGVKAPQHRVTLSQTRKHQRHFPVHARVEPARQHLSDLVFLDVRQLMHCFSFISFSC